MSKLRTKIDSLLWCDVELDLISTTIMILYNGSVIVEEPPIVAIEPNTQKVLAVGKEAMQYDGGKIVQVYFNGANSEEYNTLDIGSVFIRELLCKARETKRLRGLFYRLAIPLPSYITHYQQRVIESILEKTGVSKYSIVHR